MHVCALACGSAGVSRITPAPYEKAQASEEICKRAAHPSSAGVSYVWVDACMFAARMQVRTNSRNVTKGDIR